MGPAVPLWAFHGALWPGPLWAPLVPLWAGPLRAPGPLWAPVRFKLRPRLGLRACIYIVCLPFPHAADDHQTFNAKILADKDAAILIADKDLTGPLLKQTLQELMKDKDRLKQMEIAAKKLAMPDADKIIASAILNTKDL